MSGRGALRKVGLVGLPPVLLLVTAGAIYRESHRPKLPANHTFQNLTTTTVVATGASSGIGKATVTKLRDELGATINSGSRSRGNLDLSDLSSVRKFAQSIEKCDLLLLAAAEIDSTPGKLTKHGLDKMFATNHVGLQALLMELEYRKSIPSRVVIVGSKLERNGVVDPAIIRDTAGAKLNDRVDSTRVQHYSDTKFCNQLLVTALTRRWPETKVFVVSPGMVDTGLWRNFPLWFQFVTWPLRKIALRTPEDAALGVVYACASNEAAFEATGSLLVDGRVEEASTKSRDPQTAQELWKVVEELIQQHPEGT